MDVISGQALFLLFCLFLSCFLIFTTIGSRRNSRGVIRLPPGPPQLPIIGNIHLVGKHPHRSFAHLSKTYGPIMNLKLGSLDTVVITSPEAAREVLRTHDQILSGRSPTNSIRSINHQETSVVWLPSSSTRWRLLRRLSATQLFSPQRIEATKSLRVNKDTVTGAMDAAGKPDIANYFPFLAFLDLQGNRKTMKVCTKKLFRVFRGFMDSKKAKNSVGNNSKDVSNREFLDTILVFTKGDEAELDSNGIEHLLLDMFTAGTDTNSSTVEWAMAELLKNPKTMAKAQAEIDRVIGQNGLVEESNISELPYLQAVVKETFRLHPPVPLLVPRKAESDVEVLGFTVLIDRFLGKEIDVRGRNYELTPFGSGRRICPGLPLAVTIVSLMLATLLYSFDWKLPDDVVSRDLDMDETFGLTLHKTNPLHAVPVQKRAIN